MGCLDGRTAVVTGASRGIGRAVASGLAAEGAFVVVNYNGSGDKADEVVSMIKENGGDAVAIQCDIGDMEAASEFFGNIVREYGGIDILVNNAGINRDGLLMGMKEADFDDVIRTNLKGTFNACKLVTRPMMKKRYGRIINMASVAGVIGNAGQSNYAASKAGIIGLTKSVAKELASRGITCNAVAPGFIKTDMTDALPDQVKEEALRQIPLGTFGDVEDVAETVVFLASDKAKYITGQVICVDGGIA
ncbi:MAG: 3-oxoacyl-[acyl-carrier-protein] reductase [Eubacterium sp.]|nr:3-oxoacyl-[acyl-carrier-protein] reductase [Eubacterium sp.]